jgi:hypothetical protein
VAAGSTPSALAQQAPAAKPTGVRPVGQRFVPLTTNECLGLGGDVITATKECGTGKACTTTISAAGVKHVNAQCITKLE